MSNNYYKPAGFGGFSFFPPVIKNLIIINVIVFLIQMLGRQVMMGNGLTLADELIKYFALIPINFPYAHFYPWQLITYQFMHGGFMHIALNMFALWMFGIEIENIWGSKKFLTFYLMCGVVAGIFQLVFPPLFNEPLAPTIGASGAIFGVLIAFGMIFPNRYIFLWFLIPIKAKYFIAFFVIIEFFSIPNGGDIAHLAHLGGALAGFIYIMLDSKSIKLRKNPFSGLPSSGGGTKIFGNLKNTTGFFNKDKKEEAEDAKYYEVKDETNDEPIDQEEIDRILDKISRSGYQNLTSREKKILFEASKKMK